MVYAALAWGALQVADLLADAGFISDALVRWLIIAALAGFPVTLLISWFYEAPWRQRKGLSVMGDVAVILAIGVGIFLLAWQQYFVSFARPTLAVLGIEATDARADSSALGPYLAGQIRMALAGQAELSVTEMSSSLRPELSNLGLADRAEALMADYVLTGTLNQGSGNLRVNLQLYDADGDLAWSEGFENRLLDLGELESAILEALWVQLPLRPEALPEVRSQISSCEYPPDADAIRTLMLAGSDTADAEASVDELSILIDQHGDNGLLHLARAELYFSQLNNVPPQRRPVMNNLARQDIERAFERCPDHPGIARVRLERQLPGLERPGDLEPYLLEFPNDAKLLLAFAEAWRSAGDPERAASMAREAWRIDPLGVGTFCAAAGILGDTGAIESADAVMAHAAGVLSHERLACDTSRSVR